MIENILYKEMNIKVYSIHKLRGHKDISRKVKSMSA